MSQMFVWRPQGVPLDSAEMVFQAVIEGHRARYERTFARPYRTCHRRVGGTFIACVGSDNGVLESPTWVEGEGCGIAWAGVCESFLGSSWSPAVVRDVVDVILDRPADAAAWEGGFSSVAWDDATERVTILTGATQSRTLWKAEGPRGWAFGSRGRPLLDLVGREPEIDPVQATLFLSFGYLAGKGSLFRHVGRVPTRRHVRVHGRSGPSDGEYVRVAELLGRDANDELAPQDRVEACAAHYAERVARQARHSRSPVLSLTGGRDSRSIAAALVRCEFTVPARTAGLPSSDDVVLAARVARTLGLSHERTGTTVDVANRLQDRFGRAVSWSYASEGVETIRHALYYDAFFETDRPFPAPGEQSFNGLRPFLNRRTSPGWQRESLRAAVRSDAPWGSEALACFDAMAEELDRDVAELGGSPAHFAELHFWQVKVLHSGQDNALVKDPFAHWWTPLVDRTLLRANWHLPTESLPRAWFIESLTRSLEPRLNGLPYAGTKPTGPGALFRRVRSKLPPPLGIDPRSAFRVSPERHRSWTAILFDREARVWKDLIDPEVVRAEIASNVESHLLWSLATLEVFAEAHLQGPAAAGRDDGNAMMFDSS